jgi:hypothetical protein
VYTRSGGVWSQQGAKLVGTGAVGDAYQGISVAVSADGNTAVVGGYHDNSGKGAAWVYTRSGGVWSQQGAKLVGTGAAGGARQGVSVSVSADGNTAVVGGDEDNSSKGAAWVYTRSAGVWSQQDAKLVGTGAVGASHQGWSIAVSADGNTAVVGGYLDNSLAGAAWVFVGGTVVAVPPGRLEQFAVSAPHPNPTQNVTTISFDLPTAQRVSVSIYDVRGRLVRTLAADRGFPAGSQSLVWNRATDFGTPARAGIYLIRVSAGSAEVVRKVAIFQ